VNSKTGREPGTLIFLSSWNKRVGEGKLELNKLNNGGKKKSISVSSYVVVVWHHHNLNQDFD